MNTPVKIESMVRVVTGLGVAGLLSILVGCATNSPNTGDPQVMRSSHQTFTISFPTDPGPPRSTDIAVGPNEGDAILTAVKTPADKENTVVWTSTRSFSIMFMQIDDHAKKPSKKLGREPDGWIDSTEEATDRHVYQLILDSGKEEKKKEIRGAKYFVKSPAGCNEKQPGPNCLVLDPVIIVRY